MDEWLEKFAGANFRRSADTAHDLKTPLNVAVLNLELLRMRLGKIEGAGDDEKIAAYTAAIEAELRRLGRIFDVFFLLSTPPAGEGPPVPLDMTSLAHEAAGRAGYELNGGSPARVHAHESRMRQALKLFFGGASNLFSPMTRSVSAGVVGDRFEVAISGKPEAAGLDLSKLFKLYYSDASGNPDLSFAAARLIAETYGGELGVLQERDSVVLRLTFPLGD